MSRKRKTQRKEHSRNRGQVRTAITMLNVMIEQMGMSQLAAKKNHVLLRTVWHHRFTRSTR